MTMLYCAKNLNYSDSVDDVLFSTYDDAVTYTVADSPYSEITYGIYSISDPVPVAIVYYGKFYELA